MRPQTRKCPKCGGTLFQTARQWKHTTNLYNCKYVAERFIKPDTSQPLFLNLEVRKPKDKKFLEDIMQEPIEPIVPRRSWYYGGPDLSLVFVRTEGKKHLEVFTKEQWAKILAKEVSEK